MPTKFLIVEDHPLFADALQLAIRSFMKSVRFTHAGTLSAGKNAIRQNDDFDLVLLDLRLPDTHGFEGLLELRRLSPKLPMVVISALSDPSVVKTAMVCGAAGFISKCAPTDAVLQGIHDVLAGDVTLPDGCLLPRNSFATGELTTLTSRLNSLTRRQFVILQLLCQGLVNEQIARELHIQKSTVKAHITGVLRKLGVCSRTHAAAELSKLYLSPVRTLYASKGAVRSRTAAQRASSNGQTFSTHPAAQVP
jgi:DNA-binding NarL/FixJ family response regulator